MSMMGGMKNGVRSEINITPYIDILLVLLIIFMVVTPSSQHELNVRVPQPPPPKALIASRADNIVVSMGENARIAINNIPTDFNSLASKLREIYSARTNKNMFINASSKIPYGDVVKVIDISKGAGVIDIGLISEEIR